MARRSSRRSRPDEFSVLDEVLTPIDPLPSVPVSRLDEFVSDTLPHDGRRFSFDTPSEVIHGKVNEGRDMVSAELSERVAMQDGRRIAICVRRTTRREVLHALDRVRKSGGGGKYRRKFGPKSYVSC